MKRTGLIVLAILIFCFPLLSCVKDEEDPAISAMKAEITSLKNTSTTLTNNLAATDKKATDANTNATAALNKANQVTTPDLSPYAKKTEVPKSFYDYVDSLTSDQIATLRTKLGINSSSGSSSGSTGGSTTTTTGGISITLDKKEIISTASDTGNKDINFTVTNSSGTSKPVSLLISITPVTTYESSKVTTYQAKSTLTGFTAYVNGTKQTNPDVTTLLTKIYWIAPDFWLDNGASKPVWLNFDVKSTDVVTWKLEIKAL